ncbi:GNAT family N-acetyltransferase [Thioclava sp. BHET1]|nr:GNAT family N-acetyltransferase [Thioclava sp. BHET1]
MTNVIATELSDFRADHLEGALVLSRQAGWPHRLEDWQMSLEVSDGVVALRDGEVVGTALATRFDDVAAINLIIVAQSLRGQGFGRRLMQDVLARAQGCEQRLCATADGLPLYEKLGFTATGEVFQHQGTAQAPEAPADALPAVRRGGAADFEAFVAADHAAFGAQRRALLERIFARGSLLCTEGGYACLRDFGRGTVLGPIVAESDEAAEALLIEAARICEGRFLRIDLPDTATALRPRAQSLGLAPAGGGIAMIRHPKPAAPAASYRSYALASQALG